MNKTININLGGYFFHIDENAYQKLKKYLEAIRKYLSNDPEGKEEIISDIENRISELLSEKMTHSRQVVNKSDIDEIITIMGQPEDYRVTEENYAQKESNESTKSAHHKKLFRDGEDKFLGGVAAGISHYIGIDSVWIRLLFIALCFGGGFGVIIYILLWILLPEAKTTAEKLQMEGEKVTIDNIEKKIREELSTMKETIEEGANTVKKKVNDGFQKKRTNLNMILRGIIGVLGSIFSLFFSFLGKIMAVFIIIISTTTLILVLLALFSYGSFEILGFGEEVINLTFVIQNSLIPYWVLLIFGLIFIGFPFLVLFILGLRILSNNVKKIGNNTSLILVIVWFISLLVLLFVGIEVGTSKAFRGSNIITTELISQPKDTLYLQMVNDDNLHYQNRLQRNSKKIIVSKKNEKKIYSNAVKIRIEKSNTDFFLIKIRKTSEGKNKHHAKENAEIIKYEYKIEDRTLRLNGYFLSNLKHKFNDESVYITLYVPVNRLIYFDKSIESFLVMVNPQDNKRTRDMIDHYYRMTNQRLQCMDCDEEAPEEKISKK